MIEFIDSISDEDKKKSVKLFFILREKPKSGIKFNVCRTTIETGELGKDFCELTKKFLNGVKNKNLSEYTIEDSNDTKGDLLWINKDEVPNLKDFVLPQFDKTDLEPFKFSDLINKSENKTPNFYAIQIFDNGKKLTAFKSFKVAHHLKNHKFFKVFKVFETEKFKKADEDIIALSNSMDCVYYSDSDKVYIGSKGNFENIFDFEQRFSEYAVLLAENIKNSTLYKINGFEEVYNKFKGKSKKVRRMAKIYSNNTHNKVKRETLEKLNKDFDLKLNVSNNEITFNTEASIKELEEQFDRVLEILELKHCISVACDEKVTAENVKLLQPV